MGPPVPLLWTLGDVYSSTSCATPANSLAVNIIAKYLLPSTQTCEEVCNGQSLFVLIFWRTQVLFCGATDIPVLDFWWCLSWVLKPGWIPHLPASLPACNGFLRFTSGVIPAGRLRASMAASHIPYMHVAKVGSWNLMRRLPAQWPYMLSTWPPRRTVT